MLVDGIMEWYPNESRWQFHTIWSKRIVCTKIPACFDAHSMRRPSLHDGRSDDVSMIPTAEIANQRQVARQGIVQQVRHGATASNARRRSPVPMHHTTVYRLLKRVEREGEQAFVERRHGHPTKLRGEVLIWVLEYCQGHASAANSELQHLVAERFDLSVSVSQLNRVRAAHGLSRQLVPREKKAQNESPDSPRLS